MLTGKPAVNVIKVTVYPPHIADLAPSESKIVKTADHLRFVLIDRLWNNCLVPNSDKIILNIKTYGYEKKYGKC